MAQFILPLGNGGFRTHKYCMLRPTVVGTVLNWVKSLVLALGGYLLFTTGASILVTALYYWLLLIVNDEAWAQISLTGAAVVAGLVVARYVYVRNRSHLPSEKNLRTSMQAGVLCGWEALAALFLFTSNFTRLLPQYNDILAVPDVTLLFLAIAYLMACVASVMAIRITARFFLDMPET